MMKLKQENNKNYSLTIVKIIFIDLFILANQDFRHTKFYLNLCSMRQ